MPRKRKPPTVYTANVGKLDQDKVVWDRMRYEPNPIICDGDGPIPHFRKFYKRFYAGGDGVPSSQRQAG